MMKNPLVGGILVSALCLGVLLNRQSLAESYQTQSTAQPDQVGLQPPSAVPPLTGHSLSIDRSKDNPVNLEQLGQPPAVEEPAHHFMATAYSLRGRTASGRRAGHGVIAADHRVLPLGTRVRLEAGPYTGEYVVADTGSAVRGREIDIWVPSESEAVRFGRRRVKLIVLQRPAKRAPRVKMSR
jgi:3D (Asp-Asp-Asp) domain-containing protein